MRCLWVSLPRALLAALLLVSAGAGAASALDWQIETVNASEGSAAELLSLALDAGGTPHIGYASSGGLKHATRNGSGWEIRTVDPVHSSGLSLALDPAGAPRIAYHDSAEYDLRYAAFGASGWQVETVDSVGSVGGFPSLALDRDGTPHIGYYDATNHTIKHAVLDGSAWRLETVNQTGPNGPSGISLALDGSGTPAIAYHDLYYNRLRYASRIGGAWQTEALEVGGSPSLAFDAAGNPHISCGSTYLFYTVRDSPSWRTEWVDWYRVDEPYSANRKQPSLALDTTGTPHIGYGDMATSAVKYATLNRSTRQWETGTVAPVRWPADRPSLALDAAGNPRIAYRAGDPDYGLKYAQADIPRPVIAAVPGGADVPAGTDAAGVCDDVNGNGRKDFADVVLYFDQMTWIGVNEPLAAFDYTANGRIDFADVIWLFDHLGTPARGTFTVRAVAIGPGTIQPSGNLTVREGENVTFTLRVGSGVVTPSGTGSGWLIANEVRVDPAAAPTPYPEPTKTYGPYPTPYQYTSSYTLQDVREDHAVYGVFYKAGWMTC